MEFEQNLHTSLQEAQPQLPREKKNLGTLESLKVSLLVTTHTFTSEAHLGFEQARTPILNLTARLCKLLALRDLSAYHGQWPSSVLSQNLLRSVFKLLKLGRLEFTSELKGSLFLVIVIDGFP